MKIKLKINQVIGGVCDNNPTLGLSFLGNLES
jgi:hypothetical protein